MIRDARLSLILYIAGGGLLAVGDGSPGIVVLAVAFAVAYWEAHR